MTKTTVFVCAQSKDLRYAIRYRTMVVSYIKVLSEAAMTDKENLARIIAEISNMSEGDVDDIRDEVAKRVVELAKNRVGNQLLYDNHGSVHAKHSQLA